MSVSMSNLVNRPLEDPPIIASEVFQLLEHYLSVIRGEPSEMNRDALAELVMHQMDNTWNNADVSPAKIEANKRGMHQDIATALALAKEAYAKCISFRAGFEIKFETMAEQGRGLRCVASWIANEETNGRHIRHSSPRDTKPVGLANFIRTAIESSMVG